MDTLAGIVAHLSHESIDFKTALTVLRRLAYNKSTDEGTLADITFLSNIIELDRMLLRLFRPWEPEYLLKCNDLSVDFAKRYMQTSSLADLARAYYFSRLVIAINVPTPDSLDTLHRITWASTISAWVGRKRRSKKHSDEAIQLARTAVKLSTPGNQVGAIFLANLVHVLNESFGLFKRTSDVEEAIHILDQLSEGTPNTEVHNPERLLSLRSEALLHRWELSRNPDDLAKALATFDCQLEIANIAPAHLHNMLVDYALKLFDVYRYENEVRYLQRIDVLLEKASRIPQYSVHCQLQAITAHAILCDHRAERSDNKLFAQRALDLYEEGYKIAPSKSEARNALLNNYINSSLQFCSYDPTAQDANRVVLDKAEARLIDEGFPNDSIIWMNAGRMQHIRYCQTARKDKSALNEAVRRVRISLQMDDMASSDRRILAIPILRDYWIATRAPDDFDNIYTLIMEFWVSPTESPYVKVSIARDAARILYEAGRFQEAWEMLREAVEIIILVCPRSLPQIDQSFVISTLSGLSNDACAMGIAAGINLAEVLPTLESGRGLAVALAHAASDDYQHLTPELQNMVADFEDCRARLFFLSMSANLTGLDGCSETPLSLMESRAKLYEKFESLSKKFMEHPELEVVLKQTTAEKMQNLASDGPLVVVNSSQFRSDVILVTVSKIWSFQMDYESSEFVAKHGSDRSPEIVARSLLRLASRGDKGEWKGLFARNTTLLNVLVWLWDLVVKRVCQELRLPASKHDGPRIHRVWWLPTGYFTQMPFHAAGDYFGRSSSDIMPSRAVSSYISSFRMLDWARSKSSNLTQLENGKLDGMIVTMALPKTKRRPKRTIFVRTAEEEADAVEHEAGNISWLRKDKPLAVDVMAEIPTKNFMHFCCHGESDPKEPSQSHLKLFNGTVETIDDPQNVDKLAAESIATASSKSSILAVLSACFTADIQLDSHLDEGLHIGNAFQMAGFPHVIGSSWAASDAICPKWSRLFYLVLSNRIKQNAQLELLLLSNHDIALAYDMAVDKILKEDPFWPILWAPFVHIGP